MLGCQRPAGRPGECLPGSCTASASAPSTRALQGLHLPGHDVLGHCPALLLLLPLWRYLHVQPLGCLWLYEHVQLLEAGPILQLLVATECQLGGKPKSTCGTRVFCTGEGPRGGCQHTLAQPLTDYVVGQCHGVVACGCCPPHLCCCSGWILVLSCTCAIGLTWWYLGVSNQAGSVGGSLCWSWCCFAHRRTPPSPVAPHSTACRVTKPNKTILMVTGAPTRVRMVGLVSVCCCPRANWLLGLQVPYAASVYVALFVTGASIDLPIGIGRPGGCATLQSSGDQEHCQDSGVRLSLVFVHLKGESSNERSDRRWRSTDQ